MSDTSTRTIGFVLLIVGLVALAPLASAAVTVDTTASTDGSDASELTDGTTIDFNASPNDHHVLQVKVPNGTEPGMEITVNDSDYPDLDDETVFYRNESAAFVNYNSSNSKDHYQFNFSEDELADVPHEIDQNVTLDVTAYNLSNTSKDVTIQVTLDTTDERSVVYADGGDALEVTDENGTSVPFTDFELFADPHSDIDTTRDVNGTETDVIVVLGDDTAVDHFDAQLADLDAGTWQPTTLAQADDTWVRTYATEVPDDIEDGATTVTYQNVGGQSALVYSLGDDFEDAETVDVTAESSPAGWTPAWIQASFAYGTDAAGQAIPLMGLFGSGSILSGLFLFASTRIEEAS